MKPTAPLRCNFSVLPPHPAVAYLHLVRPMSRVRVVTCLAMLVVGCSRAPLAEPQAQQFAERSFSRVCKSYNLRSEDYDGPISTTVGGAAFAFEWHRKGRSEQGVLISITADGGDEVAFLDRGP
jgi:hypothetical protein